MIEKIKRNLLNAVLILVLFSSCKKDVSVEIQQESQSNINELKFIVTQVKTWHDSTVSSNLRTKIQDGVSAFSVNENDIVPPVLDWDKAFINFDSNTVKSITIPISMNYKNGERIQLVATKSKGKLNGYFIKITPDSSYYAKQNEIYDYYNFSGSISIYNLMGIRIKKQDLKTGIISNSNNSSKTGLPNITTFGDGFNTANDLLTVTIKSKKRKKYQFNGYNYGYIYIEEVQNIELGLGDGGVIAGGDESNDEPFDIRNKIINPCLSSLVDKIINSKISDQLNKDLKNVFGVNNKVNLIFEEAKLSDGLRAKSERDFTNPDNYTISIDLSNFDPKASEEYVASAIVHEISHMLIANTFSDHGIYNSTDREKLMLDNYVNFMQSFLTKNFNLQDKQALSMIYMGMGWLQDKKYKFWNQETEDYYFKKIEESGFNQIMNDPDYYDYFNNQFSTGSLGSNPCKF